MRGLVSFLIILAVVAIVAFNFSLIYQHTSPVSSSTGNVVKPLETKPVDRSLLNQIITPESLEITAAINEDNKINFEIQNLNDREVEMDCSFDDFQDGLQASSCFTYDSDGKFVGKGLITILPESTQVFTVNVHPINNFRIKKGTSDIVVSIKPGEYNREIKLSVQNHENGLSEQKNIPIVVTVVK